MRSDCSDVIYYVNGNATINGLQCAEDAMVNKATVVARGSITVNPGANWTIFDSQELHLIAEDDISLTPGGMGASFSVGINAVYQFWAGDRIEIALAMFQGILGSGKVKGSLVAGNKVTINDPFRVGAIWLEFEYARPEIKPEGWMLPFRTGRTSWRELTKPNWI